MRPPQLLPAFLSLAVGAGLALSLAAQESAPPPELFTDTVRVEVVNVEVFVTDKQGRRVEGLEKDDFRILVDGEPVEISNFYVRQGTAPRRRLPAPPPPRLDEPAAAATEVDQDQQLLLVIYVDNVNSRALTRNKAFRHLRLFLLRSFGPDDRFMVVSYDRRLRERHPLTTERDAVLETLFELEKLPAFRQQTDRERSDLLNEIYETRNPSEVGGLVTAYAESAFNDVNGSVDGLAQLVDSLAGVPGRKAILYLSDGLAMRAGADIFTAMSEHFNLPQEEMRALNYDVSRRLERVAAKANANRIVIYSIDGSGLRPHGNTDVGSMQAGRGTFVESTHVANLQDPLFLMANETGGQVIANTNNYAQLLARIGDDFGNYYSLGFVSGTVGSGRYHRIEVEVPGRKELVVRHREGYRDKPAQSRMREAVEAALRFGVEQNPLGVKMEFGASSRRSDDSFLVPLTLSIPMSKLVFFPSGESHHARLDLFVSARTEEGDVSPVEQFLHPITIPAEAMERALASEYRLEHQLLLGPGKMLVAVGLRDEIGAESSVVLGATRVQ